MQRNLTISLPEEIPERETGNRRRDRVIEALNSDAVTEIPEV